MKAKSEVMEDLRTIIATFENREYSGQISADTRFFADLGFVSIDAVVLGEKLGDYYQQQLPFAQFLGQLAERRVQDIQVGELADFICESLKNTDAKNPH